MLKTGKPFLIGLYSRISPMSLSSLLTTQTLPIFLQSKTVIPSVKLMQSDAVAWNLVSNLQQI